MARLSALLAVAAVVSTLFAVTLWPARSDPAPPVAPPPSGSGLLDGRVFEGVFGPPDGSADRPDLLYFNDGRFWSKNCVPCGFIPGPYRAWSTAEGIRFEGVLESASRGRFYFQGLVSDGRVHARLNWRKERWYWTIDKDFRFEGARAMTSAAPAEGVIRVALAAGPEPGSCQP